MRQTALVASLTEPPSDDGAELRALPDGVRVLEVRADLVGDLDPDWLRDRFAGELLYTLRSRAEDGAFEGGRLARRQRLTKQVGGYDLIDLEAARDCRAELLDEIPASQRLISWHGPASHIPALQQRFARISEHAARYYKLIPTAKHAGDDARTLELLRSLRREDTVVFAVGPIGTWTRLIAPRLGSPLVFGALGSRPAAPGQLSIKALVEDYGLPDLPDVERLFGIAGNPVLHSRSPRLHNGAYRALGLPCLYLPFHIESFGDFWLDVVEGGSLESLGFPLGGLSVTSPYKEVALAVSGASSPRAQHISAANTLICNDQVWEAETTDPEGVTETLQAAGLDPAGRRVAVVGVGGAGKAAAYGLQLADADVTLVNRTPERGRTAAVELHLPFQPLDELDPGAYDIVVHATALGRHDDDPLPFDVSRLRADAVVLDLVYGATKTPLVRAAEAAGIRAFDGMLPLLYQAIQQFRLMTGQPLSEALARKLLGLDAA